jgi:FMN reductase [NAD(P)H]
MFMNETLKTIHRLKSIRNFSDKEITPDDLKIILDACVRAATASARQSYSIIVVSDKELMRKHLRYIGSKALIFCVDFNRLIDIADHLNHKYEVDDFVNFITGSTDTILAAQTAAIAAKSLGIDALFTNSVHRTDIKEFYQAFNIPQKHCFPLITLVLGFSSQSSQSPRGRLNESGVIHYEKYKKLTNEDINKIIGSYENPKTNLGLSFFNSNSETYADYFDWFYNSWSKKVEEEQQKTIYSTIADAGFLDPKYVR